MYALKNTIHFEDLKSFLWKIMSFESNLLFIFLYFSHQTSLKFCSLSNAIHNTLKDAYFTVIYKKKKGISYYIDNISDCFVNTSGNLEPPSKLARISACLRQDLTQLEFVNSFQNRWKNGKTFYSNEVELLVDPFKVCIVQNILENSIVLSNAIEEFYEIEWNKRNLDLYEFFQSVDLKKMTYPNISVVYDFLKNEVKPWLETLTGTVLTDVSATCSLYGHTDYLLVHDDQQEDRLIAFVLYLIGPRGWNSRNGGALQLFSKDGMGDPSVLAKNIFPVNNQLVFFQVSEDSYHRVGEILSKDDCRMSINGWFHTNHRLTFNTPIYTAPDFGLFSNQTLEPKHFEVDFEYWIESIYLNLETATQIQTQIEEESEISLQNFLTKVAWNTLKNELQSISLQWIKVGPPNRRSYEVVLEENLPTAVNDFINLFSSLQMVDMLKHYTDLDLKTFRYELQRWSPECYSLLSDYDWSSKRELDLIMYLGPTDLSGSVVGGRTMYISVEEEVQQALILLDPVENCLNIVYRDSARITKVNFVGRSFY